MQPTKNQVEQSLAALAHGPGRPTSTVAPTSTRVPHAELVANAIGSLPEGLLAELEQTIDVRPDRLDRARAQLEHLDELTADELADRIVGRLVCDRLR
jgi:hypothetical protein